MKISYKLIQEYLDCSQPPESLAERLTLAGLEVGGIEKITFEVSRCVIGQILEINPHPNADRLTVCIVNVGVEVLTIVCGAKNMKATDKVPVALIGCVLPGGFQIKESKIRGVASYGMICSEKELNLSEGAEGLMILPAGAPIGMELASYLNLNDVILELELTPNRGDCFSIRGIAREIAAITSKKLKVPTISFPEEGGPIKEAVSIQVEDSSLCPRYSARIIWGVIIGPSPMWLVHRLKALGLRSINNVVDVTNYVLMELGQPLHAFDYDLIHGRQIIVRSAGEGEQLVTLDQAERKLTTANLVIADLDRPIALAGVMGGAGTEVSAQTRNILLESALFDQISIRRTANYHGLHTEASHRFERGIDPEGVIYALNRATELIHEVAGGKVAQGMIDLYPHPFQAKVILLRLSRLGKMLGLEIAKDRVVQICQDLGFSVHLQSDQELKVTVPVFRWDIEQEVDLIEEIARIQGYDTIPMMLPKGAISSDKKTKKRDFETWVRNFFIGLGFSEVINYSFISGEAVKNLPSLKPGSLPEEGIYLRNPLTEEQNLMRSSLMFGLCQNIAYNHHRQRENIWLFEVGTCFDRSPNGALPNERKMLGAVVEGLRLPGSWREKNKSFTIFDLKGVIESFLNALGVDEYRLSTFESGWLGSSLSCIILVNNRPCGLMGRIGDQLLDHFDIRGEVFALEINLDLLNISKKCLVKPVPKYPSVLRDLAAIVPESVSYQAVEQSIQSMKIDILQDVSLFDVYRGGQIPEGKKSFGLSLTYQSLERTLTDKEVNMLHDKVINHLSETFQAFLRE